MFVYLYLLQLEDDCYYVGKSNTPDVRIGNHFGGKASAWTKLHKPVELLKVFKADIYDEDKLTIQMMFEKGLDKVRGGSFSFPYLNKEEFKLIRRMIANAHDCCYICFGKDHFAVDCKDRIK